MAGRDGTKLNGKRLIVATSDMEVTRLGRRDVTTWSTFSHSPARAFPPPFFFFFFALSLYPVCCLESSCVCDKHLRSSEMQCLLLFYFPTPISLLFPPSFLFDVLLLVFIPCKAQFFFFFVQRVEWNVFFFWGGGLFFLLVLWTCNEFSLLSLLCWTRKKKDKVGRAGVILFLSRCDCFSFTDFAIFLPPVVPFCDGSVPSGHV